MQARNKFHEILLCEQALLSEQEGNKLLSEQPLLRKDDEN